ncbi:hypothetical protein C7M84_018078, partial [Penaeus vannamei]
NGALPYLSCPLTLLTLPSFPVYAFLILPAQQKTSFLRTHTLVPAHSSPLSFHAVIALQFLTLVTSSRTFATSITLSGTACLVQEDLLVHYFVRCPLSRYKTAVHSVLVYDFSPPSTVCCPSHRHSVAFSLLYKPNNIDANDDSYVPASEPATLSCIVAFPSPRMPAAEPATPFMLHFRTHVCPLPSQPHRLILHFRTHACPLPSQPHRLVLLHWHLAAFPSPRMPAAEPATPFMLHFRTHACPLPSQPHRLVLLHFRTHACPLPSQPHRLALLHFRTHVCPLPSQPHSIAAFQNPCVPAAQPATPSALLHFRTMRARCPASHTVLHCCISEPMCRCPASHTVLHCCISEPMRARCQPATPSSIVAFQNPCVPAAQPATPSCIVAFQNPCVPAAQPATPSSIVAFQNPCVPAAQPATPCIVAFQNPCVPAAQPATPSCIVAFQNPCVPAAQPATPSCTFQNPCVPLYCCISEPMRARCPASHTV